MRMTSAILLCLILGCSSGPKDKWNRAAVEGEIKLDGKPLRGGEITFLPTAGGAMAGAKIVDGKYKLSKQEGPVVGKNRVEIRCVQPTGRIIDSPMTPEGDGPQQENAKVMEHKELVPKKYNNESTLSAEIQADAVNQLSFTLTTTDK